MKKNILPLGFVLVILASMSLVCFGQTTRLILVGGQMGGSYELLGGAITEVVRQMYPEIVIDYRPGSGVSNVMLVSKGEADLGLTHSIIAKAGTLGTDPYEEKQPGVVAIGTSFGSKVQIVTLEKTGINSIRQIVDEKMPVRISVGDVGSTTDALFRRMFAEYGITYDDIESWGGKIYFKQATEAVELMSMGLLDVQFTAGNCPLAYLVELAANNHLKLLPVDEEVIEIVTKKYGYSKSYITHEDYDFVTEDSPTFGVLTTLIVREDLPEEIAYKITKAIGDSLDYFYDVSQDFKTITQDSMWQGTGVDLHPGAKQYYQEIGVLK